ncbi:MAG: DUF1302 family protein [Halieaceae bacterium]|jgi:hypothetical protein|nr:DUF1302 family protein [Halieaceae bacterium]
MRHGLLPCLLSVALSPAHALDFEFDSGLAIALDSTVTWGAQWRVEDRNRSITGSKFLTALQENPFLPLTDTQNSAAQTVIINGNDGNNNFDTGLVSHRLTLLMEMDLTYDSYGVFLRGKAFYDKVYRDNDTDLGAESFASYNSGTLYGGDALRGEFPGRSREQHGDNVELLDAFIYGTWEIPGDRLLDIRLGRQVINWGESTFYQGINSIQNRADATAANTPGVEIKEILLPTGAFYTQVDLLPNLSMEAYYQYEWLENELNGVGSYFSTTDQVGPGASAFLIPTPNSVLVPEEIRGNAYHLRGVPRLADKPADDSGQWGLAFHYVTDSNWDIGFYHVRGHDKKPSFVLEYIDVPGSPQPVPVSYELSYYEDIKGTAVSFTTVLGETNVQGELSLLEDTPMVNGAGDPEQEKFLKLQIGGAHVFGPSFLSDDAVIVFEGFYADVSSADSRELSASDYAWGYSFLAELNYNNVFQGWDLKVPLYVKHDVGGTIREIQAFESAKVVSLGLTATYLNNLSANLAYSFYFGGGDENLLIDRDHLAVTVKYSF